MKIISCDPGLGGALVVIEDGYPTEFINMPIIKVGSKERVDPVEVASIFYRVDPNCVIVEQVGASPMMGAGGAFSFGYSVAALLGAAAGCLIQSYTLSPQKWKTFHGLMGKDKDAARLKAIEMFPEIKDTFKRKKDVDRSDALLLGLAWLAMNKKKVK